jgi:hypothetical protein
VTELRAAHTADLDASAKSAIQTLIDAAFGPRTASAMTPDSIMRPL